MHLLLGSGGMLGTEIRALLRNRCIEFQTLHLDQAGQWIQYFREQPVPDAIINCAGVRPGMASDAEMVRVNASVPCLLPRLSSAPTFYVSTDCVFTGVRSGDWAHNFKPHEIPNPESMYGATKRIGELASDVVIRTSFIGEQHGLIRWAIEHKGRDIEGWLGARWNGSTVDVVAERVLQVVQDYLNGNHILRKVHISRRQAISKHDLLVLISEEYNLDLHIKHVYEPRINRALEPTPGYEITKEYREALHGYHCSYSSRAI